MKILVPTDFTINALHAFQIAVKFALKFKAEITLIHIEKEEFSNSDDFDLINPNISSKHNEQFEIFKQSVLHKEEFKDVALVINAYLSFGNPSLIIEKLSEEYDLIVIGARGQNNFTKKIIGSISESVINNAKCPVITVPVNQHNKAVNHFVFCEDFEELDLEILDFFENLNKISPIEVDFYHALEVSDNDNKKRIQNHTIFKAVAFQKLATKEFYFDKSIKPIPEAITEYASKEGNGILSMTFRNVNSQNTKTNLITEIFRKGETIILSFPKH